MQSRIPEAHGPLSGLRYALGEQPIVQAGQRVLVANRYPAGHYRLPVYLRGKAGTVEVADAVLAALR